jgi:hypothetical protein
MEILSADRSRSGVLIAFDDGKTALYPTDMLYAALATLEGVIDGPGPEELEERLDPSVCEPVRECIPVRGSRSSAPQDGIGFATRKSKLR